MRTGIWTTVGAALLVASVALSAAWTGTLTLPSSFPTLPPTEIVFSLLRPAAQ